LEYQERPKGVPFSLMKTAHLSDGKRQEISYSWIVRFCVFRRGAARHDKIRILPVDDNPSRHNLLRHPIEMEGL
jgi:hypothetical protein